MLSNNIGILLFAAGQSRRFGSDKLLAKLNDGRTVIEHSMQPLVNLAQKHQLNFRVIARADNQVLIKLLQNRNIDFSISDNANLGMGHSIADGVKATDSWQGWLIALADMPNVQYSFLEKILQRIKQNPDVIIRPYLRSNDQKIPTHPVYFPHSLQKQLIQLEGDQGAKSIIKNNSYLELFDDEHLNRDTIIDIDTQEALDDCINRKSVSN